MLISTTSLGALRRTKDLETAPRSRILAAIIGSDPRQLEESANKILAFLEEKEANFYRDSEKQNNLHHLLIEQAGGHIYHMTGNNHATEEESQAILKKAVIAVVKRNPKFVDKLEEKNPLDVYRPIAAEIMLELLLKPKRFNQRVMPESFEKSTKRMNGANDLLCKDMANRTEKSDNGITGTTLEHVIFSDGGKTQDRLTDIIRKELRVDPNDTRLLFFSDENGPGR